VPKKDDRQAQFKSSGKHVDFQSLMKREGDRIKGRKDLRGLTMEQSGVKPSAASSDPYGRELEEIKAQMGQDGVDEPRQEMTVSTQAALSIENGNLTWPVHLLDGGRIGRVMVVDDDAEIVKVLEEYLTDAGYEVRGLTDSHQALEAWPQWRPDLLILDVVMPGLDGVQLAQQIQAQEWPHKIIFLSGKTERDSVAKAFGAELEAGQYEFFRKPIALQQIGGRARDYFSSAHEVLSLDLNNAQDFAAQIERLSPHQLAALHSFVWDRVFEVSAGLLGRRIESVYLTDRMEPASNYMRRMGCQQRRDYCIARVCIVSNPSCAANRLRAELEIMRQVLLGFRTEYLERLGRGIGAEDLGSPRSRRREVRRPPLEDRAAAEPGEEPTSPPPKRLLIRNLIHRNR
jgi:CheY-like chemotaxis protein